MAEKADWKAEALAALDQYQESLAEERARRERELADILHRKLERFGIDAQPTSDEIEIDGVRFGLLRRQHHYVLTVIGQCRHCGRERRREIESLIDLGYALRDGIDHGLVDGQPSCVPAPSAEPAEPSTEQRLIEALRAFVVAEARPF